MPKTDKDMFDEELVKEEIITFTYTGEKFSKNEIAIASLTSELKGVEVLLKETVDFYKKKHNLSADDVAFDIFVKIENGSIKEVIKIVKKNATTLTLLGTFVMPFLQSGFEYYLNNQQTEKLETVELLESSKKIRKGFEDILVPITGDDNKVVINTGNITYEVNTEEKEKIVDSMKRHEELLENIESTREENLIGVVSVSKLFDISPFNFRVNETTQDVPLFFIALNFNLEERQDYLGQEWLIKANVKYKNSRRISIEVIEFKPLDKLFVDEK